MGKGFEEGNRTVEAVDASEVAEADEVNKAREVSDAVIHVLEFSSF